MAEIFNFYVNDDRTIKHGEIEPIMQEDHKVAVWRFRIPKVLNSIDMTDYAWWFVYVNANGQKFSEPLTLVDDEDEPDTYSIASYELDYGITYTPGSFSFALEAIDADTGGTVLHEWHTITYTNTVTQTLQGNQAEFSESQEDIISALIVQVQKRVDGLEGGATPLAVQTVAEMTDTYKVYLYTGSETGYTAGHWYYWNGSAWTDGGVYASGLILDTTLRQAGQAADAAAVRTEFMKVLYKDSIIFSPSSHMITVNTQ